MRIIADEDELEKMFVERCERARARIFGNVGVVELRQGFVDTMCGEVLKSTSALAAARRHTAEYHERQAAIAEKVACKKRADEEAIARLTNRRNRKASNVVSLSFTLSFSRRERNLLLSPK